MTLLQTINNFIEEVYVSLFFKLLLCMIATVRNIIPPPKLSLMCPDRRLNMCDFPADGSVNTFCAKSSSNGCPWKEIPAIMVTDTLFWDVPIGNTDHYYLVAWCTTIVILVGSLYLLKTIHGYKINTDRRMRKKQKN